VDSTTRNALAIYSPDIRRTNTPTNASGGLNTRFPNSYMVLLLDGHPQKAERLHDLDKVCSVFGAGTCDCWILTGKYVTQADNPTKPPSQNTSGPLAMPPAHLILGLAIKVTFSAAVSWRLVLGTCWLWFKAFHKASQGRLCNPGLGCQPASLYLNIALPALFLSSFIHQTKYSNFSGDWLFRNNLYQF